jgi:signal transduction histidine kinase
MRERVEISGGEFQIESVIGQGTTIRASWRI